MLEAVVDTNVLIYDTFSDSLYHREAALLLESLDSWLVPLIVVYEYVWFMRGLSIDASTVRKKVLEYVAGERAMVASESIDEVRWALNAVAEEGPSIARFNDKVVLSVAARRGLRLATFDRRLRRQAESIGIEVLPEKL